MKNLVITIARGYGSGGKTIGKELAEALQIPFYDREIIRLASEDSGIHERLFAQADERVKGGLFRPESRVYKGQLIPPESDDFVSDENLFNYQAKIIKELAEKSSCVIVGRCADFILKDRENVFRLFVHAPEEDCVRTVMEVDGLSSKDARRKVESIDRHRSAYYKYYTGRAWNDPRNYDLCVNSSTLGFEKCRRLVQAYLELGVSPKR